MEQAGFVKPRGAKEQVPNIRQVVYVENFTYLLLYVSQSTVYADSSKWNESS